MASNNTEYPPTLPDEPLLTAPHERITQIVHFADPTQPTAALCPLDTDWDSTAPGEIDLDPRRCCRYCFKEIADGGPEAYRRLIEEYALTPREEEDPLPPVDGSIPDMGFPVPEHVTPERVRAAVQDSRTVYEVAHRIDWEAAETRALLVQLNLYAALPRPEAPQGREVG